MSEERLIKTDNIIRIIAKVVAIYVLIMGLSTPFITYDVIVESTNPLVESFEGDFIILTTDNFLAGSWNETSNPPEITEAGEIGFNGFMSFLFYLSVICLGGSLISNLLGIDLRFFKNPGTTFLGFLSVGFIFLFGVGGKIIFESQFALQSDGSRLIFSENNVSMFLVIHDSFLIPWLKLSMFLLSILPITNKIFGEKTQKSTYHDPSSY